MYFESLPVHADGTLRDAVECAECGDLLLAWAYPIAGLRDGSHAARYQGPSGARWSKQQHAYRNAGTGAIGKSLRVSTNSFYTLVGMSIALKKFACVLLITALPQHALAAIVMPLCPQDAAGESAHDHAPHVGHQYDHDRPLTANDNDSDYCGAGSTFAPPVASVGWAGGSAVQHDSFTATHYFGFIPEQPQRPPLV